MDGNLAMLNQLDFSNQIDYWCENETFKDIPGYQGYYQVSSFGRVKSLRRNIILKPRISKNRIIASLQINGNVKQFHVSRLVFLSFHGFLPKDKVIDHIDNDSKNNNLGNLQQITQRVNCSKDKKNKTSTFTGVSKHKGSPNKWTSQITINGKTKFLGSFDTEIEAHEEYKKQLKSYV